MGTVAKQMGETIPRKNLLVIDRTSFARSVKKPDL